MNPHSPTPLEDIAAAIDRNTEALREQTATLTAAIDRLGLTLGATLDPSQHATLASLLAEYAATRGGPE